MKKLSVEEVRRIVGLRIRKKRREIDMTQKTLGQKIGCVTSHICDIEKGRKAISCESLYNIESVIGPVWGNF